MRAEGVAVARCVFCGGERTTRDHHCDGRQGHVEAVEQYDAWARRTDPDTSHAAAAAVDAAALEYRTMAALPLEGELTTEEIGHRLHVPRDSVSPRMRSLERKGLVERRGKRRNASGVHAIAWALTAAGRLKV